MEIVAVIIALALFAMALWPKEIIPGPAWEPKVIEQAEQIEGKHEFYYPEVDDQPHPAKHFQQVCRTCKKNARRPTKSWKDHRARQRRENWSRPSFRTVTFNAACLPNFSEDRSLRAPAVEQLED